VRVGGEHHRTIQLDADGFSVDIIDQRQLPHVFERVRLSSTAEVARAIREMWVRGAPLIGAAAAYGLALAVRADPSDQAIERACAELLETRPTAVNLAWALGDVRGMLAGLPPRQRAAAAYARAAAICDEDVAACRRIGEHGLALLADRPARPGQPLHVLTHCNAGWLATVDWGTALAPIYLAHERGVPVHVWVDETRPRLQGALTAWELGQHGIPHTLVTDNASGLLLARGEVDVCIVGTDRTTAEGDVLNKVGTYLKALAARAAGVPFYVAAPGTSIDFAIARGADVPIEFRAAREVTHVEGRTTDGRTEVVAIAAEGTPAWNPGFDVTPAALVTALVTERGVCAATREGLAALYPERA
jgi:methylthioribose-1-phosphate isomerase